MNKEEFQTKKNDINSKIRELKSQKIQLEKECIESNAKYPIGSKDGFAPSVGGYIPLLPKCVYIVDLIVQILFLILATTRHI